MLDSFYIASIGMHAHARQIDSISQNVANLNTVGYKRGVLLFSSLSGTDGVGNSLSVADASGNPGSLRGAGVTTQLGNSMVAGTLAQTNAPLDLAIDGPGFLEVTRADGTPAYTRAGSLTVDAQGMLVTKAGETLAAKITVPPDAQSVTIASDGRVYATLPNSTASQELGQIDLVMFANPESLQAVGGTLYVTGPLTGEPRTAAPGTKGLGVLHTGYLESSNVDMTTELTQLMLAQRGFELNSRVAQAADQMVATANTLYR